MRWGVRDEMTDEHMTTVYLRIDLDKTMIIPSEIFDPLTLLDLQPGSMYERVAGLSEVQHGTKLHLLWSTKVRQAGN